MPRDRRRPSAARLALALPLLAALLLLPGCASSRRPPAVAPAGTDSLWLLYEKAVAAAKYPRVQHVSTSLVPISTSTPGLVWDASRQRVLMSTWAKAKYYTQQPPYETTIPVDSWLTAVPFLRRFCARTGLRGDALRLRVAERLGLPPDASNDVMVQMWVDPHALFRPCPDPEVTDRECEASLTAGPVDTSGACPWGASQDQLSGHFVSVDPTHLDWMCRYWTTSAYPPGEPRKSYPWTALGYTYDWGAPDFHGESEFVLPANTPITIESVTPTDAYCSPGARAGG